ncbi:hypothetical protein L914_18810 [Phytophthora nicotianae]|uniref:MULE transposase domain-containing protein n=1 Tax=Phytophthora nicotianae TaxID=4792 RepID=W2MET6_PHYNI|nr:hypothetical protein L914_18810 [Phytophthora nicotianae]
MVYDQASELFVPVYFVLCSSKAKDMYFDILKLIYRDTSEKLEPCDVVCDFEMPMIQAIEKQFLNAEVIGCLFHFKQAVRRQMKTTYSIPDAEVCIAMEKGVLDVLKMIDPNLVPRHGIRCFKRTIRAMCVAAGIAYTRIKWKQFWGYFRATWLERTNNPIERLNRELNRSFPTPHPNIATFVNVIWTIFQDYVTMLTNVAQGRRSRGNKINASKKRGRRRANTSSADGASVETIDLPNPVVLTEEDLASNSDSEDEMQGSDIDSGVKSEVADVADSDEDALPDFSFDPSEYCDDDESTANGDDQSVQAAIV